MVSSEARSGSRNAALMRQVPKLIRTGSKLLRAASLMIHGRSIRYTTRQGSPACRRPALAERVIGALQTTADLKTPSMMAVAVLRERAWRDNHHREQNRQQTYRARDAPHGTLHHPHPMVPMLLGMGVCHQSNRPLVENCRKLPICYVTCLPFAEPTGKSAARQCAAKIDRCKLCPMASSTRSTGRP